MLLGSTTETGRKELPALSLWLKFLTFLLYLVLPDNSNSYSEFLKMSTMTSPSISIPWLGFTSKSGFSD